MEDEPTTFWFDDKPYEPSNFEHKFYGPVTLRRALAHSMNIATVKVAEMVGYDKVVEMANRAGMNYKIQPTPAVALGAYEVTPFEMAGAYTIFRQRGRLREAQFHLHGAARKNGKLDLLNKPEKHQALDPRVAYLMTNLMEEVMRTGTAAGVRGRNGFNAPAAGKTGTSHDGWFAGFTSELLCIVWVGFDDNRELELEGAHRPLPIWAEFMKRALQYREYSDAKPFTRAGRHRHRADRPAVGHAGHAAVPADARRKSSSPGTQPVGSLPCMAPGSPA